MLKVVKQESEITPEEITDNIVITELNFDELKKFVLYESYYQEISNLDIDKEIIQKNNDIWDYHYKNVYGNSYSQNISNTKFQIITTYEKNNFLLKAVAIWLFNKLLYTD